MTLHLLHAIMWKNSVRRLFVLLSATIPLACGGYDAADPEDITARTGEIVGVLVDANGNSSPDAVIQLIESDGTTILLSDNMDSDGRFGVFPPKPGVYNLLGAFGDTEKVIRQGVQMTEGLDGVNVGKLQAATVGAIAAITADQTGNPITGVQLEVLGTPYEKSSLEQGVVAVAGIPPGVFQVRLSKSGYATQIRAAVNVGPEELIDLGTITMTAK